MILNVTSDEFSEIQSKLQSMHSIDFSFWLRERYSQLSELQFLESVEIRVVGEIRVDKPRGFCTLYGLDV